MFPARTMKRSRSEGETRARGFFEVIGVQKKTGRQSWTRSRPNGALEIPTAEAEEAKGDDLRPFLDRNTLTREKPESHPSAAEEAKPKNRRREPVSDTGTTERKSLSR